MAQTEIVQETAKLGRSEAKGYETSPDSTRSLKTALFLHFWIIFDFLVQKYQREKHLCKVV